MSAKTKLSRIMSAGAVALLAGTAVPTVLSGTAQAQIACPTGYVCLERSPGIITRIAEGQRWSSPAGVPVDVATNNTRLTYCVTSTPYNYTLAPGRQVTRRHTVYALTPGAACPL